ncbi:hypothetical protein ACWD3L_18055, partial [Streptomyces sp. NPDC002587]
MSNQFPPPPGQQPPPGYGYPPPGQPQPGHGYPPPPQPKKSSAGKIVGFSCLGVVGVVVLLAALDADAADRCWAEARRAFALGRIGTAQEA